ncbi:hypothetical protein F5X71_01320 [Nocardia brasiliensis]|uniref:Uncharacterized protein n=1 Tax=Nocardia brasiliensis TaxID=37326 RepID=A0A6G9XJP7_NOCBR|nr:hypothetical protein [Nocardia brasiliensis]QIS01137.1 hypothetical protein F5X71_01320 [Nocardia brasiliensis]
MAGSWVRLVSGSTLLAAVVASAIVTAGPAAAEPRDCTLDRSLTGATGFCPGGDGFFTVEADCIGISIGRDPGIGPYRQSSQRHAYAGPHPEMDATQTHPHAECNEFITGHFGILVDARLYETFR